MTTTEQSLDLAVQHHQAGRLPEAEALYQQVLQTDSGHPTALHLLGVIACQVGNNEAAVELISKALAIQPEYADAHSNLGNALKELGRMEEAAAHYRQALVIQPDSVDALSNLGAALNEMGRPGDAAAHLQKALALKPDFADAHYNLGKAQKELGMLDAAAASYRSAIALRPEYADAHSNLGAVLTELGWLDDAADSLRQALALKPDLISAGKNLLYTLLNVPELTPQQRYAEHQRFADSHTGGISPAAAAFNNDADPNRKLRIGYLSSDLRNHPTGVIMLPLLSGHDRENVEIFCYADVAQPDAMTARFQGAVDHWQSVTGRTDGQVAEMIRADGIDVLVSLCGHFDDNRPLVSAYRAAPVQVSLFDGSTSGLAEMDYWLTDGFLHPADTTEVFTEQLHRLPLLYQWSPIEGAPPVGPLPSDAAGHITFGSFNNPAKVNDAVINLWADALKAVPGSTLVLKYIDWYGQASLQGRIRAQFGALGIEKGRIALEASSDTFTEHLGWYGGIDIALDTFPFNGAATTFQALWMGVPVVSLVGDTFISRMSGSMLHPAGLGDLAVETPAAYVECARALAGDHGRLRDLRANLRGRISASALCDAVAYPRNVEAAYREMWQGWCAKTSD